MVDTNLAKEIAADNRSSLRTLRQAIVRFKKKFSLTLVCCDDIKLRSTILKELSEGGCFMYRCQLLVLEPSTTDLYQTIVTATDLPAKPLMVSGIESVVALDDLLVGANLAREQFEQNLPFSLLLWVTDSVLGKFIHSPKDLMSWTPAAIEFIAPPETATET
jgi:hypothetical protein